jgi:hypothetical protein
LYYNTSKLRYIIITSICFFYCVFHTARGYMSNNTMQECQINVSNIVSTCPGLSTLCELLTQLAVRAGIPYIMRVENGVNFALEVRLHISHVEDT